MAKIKIENESKLNEQLNQVITQDVAKELANLYNSFIKNRKSISSRVTRFINRAIARQVMEVHCENNNYQLMHPDLTFFSQGYALINKIRELLGQEPTDYMVGILNQTTGQAAQIQLKEKEFLKYMRERGDKAALSHSMDTVEKLLKDNRAEDISDSFIPFLTTVENKVKENNDSMNYGYAFESYGHFTYQGNSTKDGRHDAYYNYYRASRKNTLPWTTGGDVGNLQYKLIRVYTDEKGQIQISSASITSSTLIIKELQNLKNLINAKETLTPGQLSIELAKSFSQINLPEKINKGVLNKIDELLLPLINQT